MNKEKNKWLNQFTLKHSFHGMLESRKELDLLSKDAAVFFMGVFLFLCGFLFNLSASIIYDLIKDNRGWKILILVATSVSLIILVWLIQKYVIIPIKKQKEKLEKYRIDTHSAIDQVADDLDDKNDN